MKDIKKLKSVVFLTGDTHHMSMLGKDQKYLRRTEVDASIKYAEIAQRYGVHSTLFTTGKCVQDEPEKLSILKQNNTVELGGHTYSAFKPLWVYRLSHLFLNRRNGPKFLQNNDIKKTTELYRDKLGINITSWRNHGYRNDQNTHNLLSKNGIKILSDSRCFQSIQPLIQKGLIELPINTLPDHDYIYHGDFNNENIPPQGFFRGTKSPERMTATEWLKTVTKQVENIINKGGVVTLLVHPACMEITDDFKIFNELCLFLSDFECRKLNSLLAEPLAK